MTIPRVATYRLQFRNGMTFDRAVDIVPYLRRLGISHLYASPVFTAVSGSTHGYDVTDHNEIDPAIGGQGGFERLCEALQCHRMGLVLDIVPNHMAASLENRWWSSVVEFGSASPYARHFDVDWSRKLTLPVLGRDYREVLAAGELSIRADAEAGCLALAYFDHPVPLHPATYAMVAGRLDRDHAAVVEALAGLRAGRTAGCHDARTLLAAHAMQLRDPLGRLSADAAFIDGLHAEQPWRLMSWQCARRQLSYRRFFEVTGLVGVRVEDDAVFDDVHRLALSLVREGVVEGLRVDHVDGLAFPGAYLRRLRQEAGPGTWLMAEKILAAEERLPADLQRLGIGTTGYEFISAAANLLVDAEGAARLRTGYEDFIGRKADVAAELRAAKLLVLKRNFEGELRLLVAQAARIAEAERRDFERGRMEDAIVELIVAFPIYRTYAEDGAMAPQDRAVLDGAVNAAAAFGAVEKGALGFLAGVLGGEASADPPLAASFRMRFQQLTGPIMAKAVEDTLFYRHNALIAFNEVGSSPEAVRLDVERFHRFMQERTGDRAGLLATATHDTKRGEDGRARLYALAEDPVGWSEAVRRWSALNARFRTAVGTAVVPEAEVEWLLYQSLAGIWPAVERPDEALRRELSGRFLAYVEKALREAKLGTDWLAVNEPYEAAVLSFASRMLEPGNRDFLDDFGAALWPLVEAGAISSVSQTLAKVTGPGVPDIYQGAERLDLSLVDPDNRRPVDFDALAKMLADADPDELRTSEALVSGRFKQWMAARCLACRAEHERLFAEGRHVPLPVTGGPARHFVAYLRETETAAALIVFQRLPLQRLRWGAGGAAFVHLPDGCYRGAAFRSALTGAQFRGAQQLDLQTILDGFPAGLAIAFR